MNMGKTHLYILHNKKQEFFQNVKRDSPTLVERSRRPISEIYQTLGLHFIAI